MAKLIPGVNDLATANPRLTKEWHPTKNGELTPEMVTVCSGKKVYWLGSCEHEWTATIADRNNGKGCPFCKNKAVLPGFNDLSTTNPKLADEWHPTKNGVLTPEMITAGSEKKVWWLGTCGHEWESSPSNRQRGRGCPICNNKIVLPGYNDLATTNPELADEWHPTKNDDLTSAMVIAGSKKKVWWLGSCGHEWKAAISDRQNGRGCPFCSHASVLSGFNDLATINPELAAEWHPTKNGELTPTMATAYSKKRVWWLGSCGHEWKTVIYSRQSGSGCPFCNNKTVLPGFNDLATTNPELAIEWHPTKNGKLTPAMVTSGSRKKVWWRCVRGHEWETAVYNRKRTDCPICEHRTQYKKKYGF